jgi:hypothetical protein
MPPGDCVGRGGPFRATAALLRLTVGQVRLLTTGQWPAVRRVESPSQWIALAKGFFARCPVDL